MRFVEPFAGVGFDLQQARHLSEIQSKYRASYAGVFVLTRRPVRAFARSEGDLAQLEVVTELGSFGVGGFAVLLAGSCGVSTPTASA